MPSILSDALSVALHTSIGHDYIEDAESRYDFYHKTEERIPFDLDIFNKITKNGLPKKTLTVVMAPPGVGKSFGIERVLAKHDIFPAVAQDDSLRKYEIAKGNISALGLYQMLWNYRDKKSIIVFDDCDSVLFDDVALNVLKAALDTGKKRMLSWHTESRILAEAGIPKTFNFEGGCIFITNVKFDHVRSKKLRDHLEALESRCHYLDLTIDSDREKMLRIKQMVNHGMLDRYEFENNEAEEIIDYIDANRKRMRELSLRMVIKVADLRKSMPKSWESVAAITCMRA